MKKLMAFAVAAAICVAAKGARTVEPFPDGAQKRLVGCPDLSTVYTAIDSLPFDLARNRRAGMVASLHAAAYRVASRKVREVRKVISSGSRASFPHFHIFIIPYFHNMSAVALAKVDSTISHFSWARVRP